MKRAIALILPALLLAACETSHPPRQYYGDYPPAYPPPLYNAPRSVPTQPVNVAPSSPMPMRTGNAPRAVADIYMDRQEADLRKALKGSGFLVARQGDNLSLNLKSDVLFAPNSTTLTPEAAQFLTMLANTLNYYNHTSIEVDGYTDTTGAPDKNMTVSQHRADAVSRVLQSGGVDSKRIRSQGFGENSLKIPTGDNVNESRNRRVEIHIVPNATG
jgi:outer membrane protein OmpA-like peptidoglycan-associated protein